MYVARPEQHFWEFRAPSGEECDQLRKAFLERAFLAGRVPDEVTDSEGRKVFAGVPGGQPGDGAVAFVLPDLASDPLPIRGRQIDRGRQERAAEEPKNGRAAEKRRRGTMCS